MVRTGVGSGQRQPHTQPGANFVGRGPRDRWLERGLPGYHPQRPVA